KLDLQETDTSNNLHPYDVFFERNVFPDLRRNLWSLGKFYTTRRGESEGSSISFRLREFSSRIFQPRDLCGRILVLIKTRSQDLSGLRFNGCRTDIIRSVLVGKWRHMRRSRVLMTSRRWDSGVGGGFWWGLVDWQSENQGVVEWRLRSNLRGVDLVIEKGNFGKLRRLGISANWITISIIIKTKSKGYTVRDEAQEDGEIRAPESLNKTRPSPAFQAEHDKTQKIGTDALSDPMEVEKGLQIIQSLVEKAPVLEDDKVMNMDEFRAVFLEHGIDMDATDDLPDVSDGEIEEMLKEQEEGDNIQGEVEVGNDAEEKVQVEGEVGKKNGSRKRLFKPTLGTAVSTKMRIANALASPHMIALWREWQAAGEQGTFNPEEWTTKTVNKKDLFLFWHLVHRVRIFTVTLQIYLGTLGIFGLSGGIFSNSWERGINDRYNNTAKACFFLNFILVWIVKPNRSVIVLGMVVEDITFLVTEWYEQMIELFGFLYIVVTTMEMHYTDIKVRLRVEDLTTKFNIIAWLGNFDVASLKCIIFSLKARYPEALEFMVIET
ncbi:hypothetical protein HID58_085830, partial [Brassica napus]